MTFESSDDAAPQRSIEEPHARALELVPDALEHESNGDERDQAAERRDRGAEQRDALARLLDASDDPLATIEAILSRAERDRGRAASDRARASDDRARASVDRREAARDRREALVLRAEAASNLKLAATDGLTGVWTRTFGLDAAAREVERAQRTGQRVVVAFIDVDGLKRVNDRHGHQEGDALLRAVGQTLLAGLRPYDVIVRFGGDEFLGVLPDIAVAEARMRLAEIAVTLAAGNAERTFSVGLAAAGRGETLDALVARADRELLATRRR
jgi:diguanylate cyclase (GGDEF)-like protein